MSSYSHLNSALTVRLRRYSMMDDIPAMPLIDAHFGGFFVSGSGPTGSHLKEAGENQVEEV
ncbi:MULTISPECIES: hypothetical protein [unclassified Chromohalobacter]|uniref:hypothetical protein n=1 Tax=unclassified Chromohalobacter TaxID=2628571 RepID=UPI002469AEB9|nr:hypothetical protein [Chromohalobacter sp. 11-W]